VTEDERALLSWGSAVRVVDPEDRWDKDALDEVVFWPRTMWIDPGVVSGVAVVWFDPKAVLARKPISKCVLAWWCGELRGDERVQIARFHAMALSLGHGDPDWSPGLVVGAESFDVRRLDRSAAFLSPVRIAHTLDFLFWRRETVMQWQTPSDAKVTMTDARLKVWNMYTKGPDHQRDATRHCLLWLRKLSGGGVENFTKTHGDAEEWWE
jgi:hypothetical protein